MKKDIFALTFIVIFGAVLYGLTLRGAPGNPQAGDFKEKLDLPTGAFELSPERGRYVQTASLAERGTYSLDKTWALVAYPDVGVAESGSYYSFFAPGVSYMALPFYLVGSMFGYAQVGTFSVEVLFTLLTLVFIYLIGRKMFGLSVGLSIFAALIFGFGSTAWSYSVTLYQHAFTTFFMVSSVYAIWRYSTSVSRWSFLYPAYVWAAYGLAIFVDYPNAILMLPVMVYLFLTAFSLQSVRDTVKLNIRMSAVVAALAFVLITGLHFWHNQYYFGSWKQLSGGLPTYQLEATPADTALIAPPLVPANEIAATQAAAVTATSTAAEDATSTKNVVAFFHERKMPQGFDVLLFSGERGLFFFTPLFILSFFGFGFFCRKNKGLPMPYAIMAALVATNIFLYASWGDPWGGWAFGPRYLIPSMPWLALFAAWFVSQGRHIVMKKIGVYALFLYSSAIALVGALTSNAVPPKSEALLLPIKTYNFMKNFGYLQGDQAGDFVYNTY
ncbi:MAG: hypothetical protein JWO00_135 [Candidatus Parcubacteria bacterium]|nr:hypothetical protein [Candidatus Parcubacteria bacterium]